MDAFTEQHLAAWLDRFAGEEGEYREETERKIRGMLAEYPEAIKDGRSWPEILSLAARNEALGIGARA